MRERRDGTSERADGTRGKRGGMRERRERIDGIEEIHSSSAALTIEEVHFVVVCTLYIMSANYVT